ncbi:MULTISPECIES: hypothetical protein [unclassified Streptomyces]|uniref:hypothetical protein n=1 Tax=unclassified Streptomyces TaxID=2593676 RepID=UPI0023669EE4|nr:MULTISPECIES: hypothetical protein [unclassified Streptomyces]MDF3144164.1 hypothetical protein [Streptomyces sp. T21Q-yed]WDF45082.1 hypothetical protein PBV52_51195 [Streptomyces sp. T12]
MANTEDERELADALQGLRDAEERLAQALRTYLAPDPLTGRPPHGRIGRAMTLTGWGEQRVKETVNPGLAERRRAQRAAAKQNGRERT